MVRSTTLEDNVPNLSHFRERLDADQLALALEDLEQTLAVAEAGEEKDGNKPTRLSRQRRINRGALPPHLPREEVALHRRHRMVSQMLHAHELVVRIFIARAIL